MRLRKVWEYGEYNGDNRMAHKGLGKVGGRAIHHSFREAHISTNTSGRYFDFKECEFVHYLILWFSAGPGGR